jgi:2-oxoglutarate dehydrogenase E1 component
VIHDTRAAEDANRLIFCSGRIAHVLEAERERRGLELDVAICRVEEIAPFPGHAAALEAERFPDAEVVWCQEEPVNMGAWTFVSPRLTSALEGRQVTFAGRPSYAAPATGVPATHKAEEAQLITDAFGSA